MQRLPDLPGGGGGGKKPGHCLFLSGLSGMKVKTRSERVLKARRMVMELILSDHPLDCMTCEKTGDCRLQDLAYEMGLTESRLKGSSITTPSTFPTPSSFAITTSVSCANGAHASARRSSRASPSNMPIAGIQHEGSVPYHRGLQESDCVFCGQCVSVCPWAR